MRPNRASRTRPSGPSAPFFHAKLGALGASSPLSLVRQVCWVRYCVTYTLNLKGLNTFNTCVNNARRSLCLGVGGWFMSCLFRSARCWVILNLYFLMFKAWNTREPCKTGRQCLTVTELSLTLRSGNSSCPASCPQKTKQLWKGTFTLRKCVVRTVVEWRIFIVVIIRLFEIGT